MITNASEFPCIEATRCLVTEQEMGMRLTVKTLPNHNSVIGNVYANDLQNNPHVVTFSKERSPKQEWYLHLDFARSGCEGQGARRRVLQLRHSETGQYLSSDDKGRVSCSSTPSPSTYWWMELANKRTTTSTTISSPSSSKSLSDSTSDESSPSDGQYILMSKEHAPRELAYTTNLKGFNGSDEDFQLITCKNSGQSSTWELKFTSGELCFMSNPVVHCQMRCNMLGQLSLNSGLQGWEVFRFIEVGNGNGDLYISSWTHYTKFLSSDSDGQVYATDMGSNPLGYAERWRLEPSPSANGLYLKNVASRRYLSVGRKAGEALWTTTKPNDYALWHLDAAHSHIYYLTSLFASTKTEEEPSPYGDFDDEKNFDDEENNSNDATNNRKKKITTIVAANDYNQTYSKEDAVDMHISSAKKGPFLTKNKRKWEEWKVEVTPDGDVTFFSIAHEKYLGCNSKGDVHTTTSKGAWTVWEKHVSPHGGVMFLSREHLRFLAVSEVDGSLCTTPGDEEWNLSHSWRMDPRLPRSISGGKIAGAMGLAITVAMPFAVLGAIEAAGATITEMAILGISAEALAGVGAGAAIGAGMVGTAAALVPNDSKAQSDKLSESSVIPKECNLAAQRPISGWKSWIKLGSESQPSSSSPPPRPSLSPPTYIADVTSDIPRMDKLEKGSFTEPTTDLGEIESPVNDLADAITEITV